ncbi:serpin family protein [Polyangium jinanense]|uniref:Serpin family protein n=1 Tax=Polyangium jinanense TaxID=2829994 RepID=A0A9X4AY91_9BACT|nr:serpin family protein [Polyangium jinanense]MDC3960644.1 serpin family protein [Polyangium jinanense]MDC3986932.1 serpin family protein [Polyangium jinanense]
MRTLPLFSLLLSLSALACSSSAPPEPPGANNTGDCHDPGTPGCVVTSGAQRITNPNVPSADLGTLVDGNTAFAVDMYKTLRSEPGNFFYSPHSISSALAMTWAGARGQTETDMAKALHFNLPQAQLHPAYNALDLALASRGKDAKGSDGQGFRLNIANAVWGQVNYPFETAFLDVLGTNYGAGMNIVDFVEGTDQALALINGWVEKKTEGKIKDILSPDSIDSSTRLVLTNAVYFNAAWRTPFEEENTQNASFTTSDGASVTVPMMQGYVEAPYVKGAGYAAVELPYDGDELSMVLVLPDDLDAFEGGLDAAKLSEVVGGLSEHSVDTRLPKFKFESKFSLVDPLKALGMGIAFTDGADLSGINGTGGLFISDVIHQSFVSVNEAGTEAAAATAVIVGETSAPQPAAITFDKPFMFFIRDIATKSVLFVGRVADPS